MMKRRLIIITARLNLPRHVSSYLFGKDHTISQRLMVGAIVIVCGVLVCELPLPHVILVPIKVLGHSLQAFGAHPVLEWASKQK